MHGLHGSMDLAEQDRVLSPSKACRVIVATNVAETGLTIPGVTVVIDSGLHRVAGYDAARGINTLSLSKISRANADQRAGRAGRTAPGRCLRLWSRADESSLQDAIPPEIERLELSSLYLKAAFLPGRLDWLTEPKRDAWAAAAGTLRAVKAVDEGGRITPPGRALLRYPVSPRLASVLAGARLLGPQAYANACAMAAVLESAAPRRKDRTFNLYELAAQLQSGAEDDLGADAREIFQQLKKIGEADIRAGGGGELGELWLEAYADKLAARQGEGLSYRLADGRSALLPLEEGRTPPKLILALEVQETAGAGQARRVSVPVFLPCEAETVRKLHPDECSWRRELGLDEKGQRVEKRELLVFRGLALESRRAAQDDSDRKAAAGLWAQMLTCGEIRHPGFDEGVEQLVARIRLARRHYPGYSFPEMGLDDWRLIYEELCAGKDSLKEIERASIEAQIAGYIGPALMSFLDKAFPMRKKLPSGRTGKFAYFENRPPELCARLGDFLGMNGTMSLCEGRLPVLFDILAPNYRTVQKTHDLGSFWKSAYPSIKKELQRKYPKHPWP